MHLERHSIEKVGWLRAAVLGANDGIVSTASLVLGVASANTSSSGVLLAGVAGLVSSARNAVLYRKFTEALKTVMESNRIVRNADRSKVVSYAETIYKFAPHVASDVNLLSQLLANAIHGEGVDPSTIETITRLEERYSKDMSFKPKNFT